MQGGRGKHHATGIRYLFVSMFNIFCMIRPTESNKICWSETQKGLLAVMETFVVSELADRANLTTKLNFVTEKLFFSCMKSPGTNIFDLRINGGVAVPLKSSNPTSPNKSILTKEELLTGHCIGISSFLLCLQTFPYYQLRKRWKATRNEKTEWDNDENSERRFHLRPPLVMTLSVSPWGPFPARFVARM